MPSDRASANSVLNENCGAKTCEDESVLIKSQDIELVKDIGQNVRNPGTNYF